MSKEIVAQDLPLGKDRPAPEISIWATSTDMASSEFERKSYFIKLKDGDKEVNFSLQVHAGGAIVAVPYVDADYNYTDYEDWDDDGEDRCDFCGEYNCFGDCLDDDEDGVIYYD
jgi:hypothetical protein